MKLRKNQSEVLNPKQKQAISELTRQDNNSLQEVAKKVGISIATLYRWRKKPEFSTALEESFRELKEEVESKESASTNKQSLVSKARYYYNLQRIRDIETMILLNTLKIIPTIIEDLKNLPMALENAGGKALYSWIAHRIGKTNPIEIAVISKNIVIG